MLSDREVEWGLFLNSLEPWELHKLFKRELEAHDLFIEGMSGEEVYGLCVRAEVVAV